MGKWRAIIPIVISLAIAITGSIFLYKWIIKQTTPREVTRVEAEAVNVVIAKVDLPWGTKIKPEVITTASFLKESLPPGHFSNLKDLNGRVVISPLKRGDPVTEHRLAPIDVKTGGVAAILKQGKRAVSVRGDKVAGIAGFINPGHFVDVLVTINDPKKNEDVTKIVLEKLLVLGTGTQIVKDEQGKPAPVDVYTLEVTPEEAEKLTFAATKGRLQFALRGLTDTEDVDTKGATISQTLAASSSLPTDLKQDLKGQDLKRRAPKGRASKSQKRKWVPRRQTITVELIKGIEMTKMKLDF